VGAAVFDEAPGPLGLLGGLLILAGGVAVALQPAPARDAASAPET
jgi:drug/metabolite transporter (DMT)-like permease